jgi:hypothetical protein
MYEVVGESQKISRIKKEEVRSHNAEVKANILLQAAFKNSAISSAVR